MIHDTHGCNVGHMRIRCGSQETPQPGALCETQVEAAQLHGANVRNADAKSVARTSPMHSLGVFGPRNHPRENQSCRQEPCKVEHELTNADNVDIC